MSTISTGNTPLTTLYEAAYKYPSRTAFKIPMFDTAGKVKEWSEVTYSQLLQDVESFARYWSDLLLKDGITARSVVTLFLSGYTYFDVLHIYGILRAGYIPQPLSVVPTAKFILPLLKESQSKALIFELLYTDTVKDLATALAITTYPAISSVPQSPITSLPDLPEVNINDIAILFVTSGSTSGRPKIVPGDYRWLDSMVTKSSTGMKSMLFPHKVNICFWMGSICHVAQFITTIRIINSGSTLVQPLDSSNSLVDLIEKILLPGDAGITQLSTFPVVIMRLIRRAQQEEPLRKILIDLDAVAYGGGSLPAEEERWAVANGINLVNVFASTECAGILMVSDGSRYCSHNGLRPVKGVHYRFEPAIGTAESSSSGSIIRELIVLPESFDCPHPSLRSADGLFHTGDLFKEIPEAPGCYINCGRDDDWIKMESAARCDTRTIEDEVRHSCKDLIAECVVVGKYRPKPALFVECLTVQPEGKVIDEAEGLALRKMIYERIWRLQEHRYEFERIAGPDMIIVVPQGSLPRTETKGNVRRALVEEQYQKTLERIYAPGTMNWRQ